MKMRCLHDQLHEVPPLSVGDVGVDPRGPHQGPEPLHLVVLQGNQDGAVPLPVLGVPVHPPVLAEELQDLQRVGLGSLDGEMSHGVPVSVGQNEAGDGQESLHDGSVAEADSFHDGRKTETVHHIPVHAGDGSELLDTPEFVVTHSVHHCRLLELTVIPAVEIYTRHLTEPLHSGRQTTNTGPHQGSHSEPIGLVDIGTLGEEKLQLFHFLETQVKTREAMDIRISPSDVSSKIDQSLDSLKTAISEGSEEEGPGSCILR